MKSEWRKTFFSSVCRYLIVFISLIVLAISGQGSADQSPDEQDNADESTLSFADTIVITANDGLAHALEKDTGFISVVETDPLVSPFAETADVLENVVGVTVNQYGGLGMFSFISIRGSEANQVSYYLNGIPLNSATSGYFNLGSVPLGFLEHIEVYRGWTPPTLGQPALGGAVNFVTRSKLDGSMGQIAISAGSFDTYQGSLSIQTGNEKNRWLLYSNRLDTKGDFSYVHDNGTPNNTSDDRTIDRTNADLNSNDFLLNYVHQPSETFQLTVLATYQDKEHGVPGNATLQTESTHLDENSLFFDLSSRFFECFHDRSDFTVQLFHHYLTSDFSDPEGEVSLLTRSSEGRTNRTGLRLLYSASLPHSNTLSFASGFSRETNTTSNEVRGIFVPGHLEKNRLIYYVALDDKWLLFNDRFQVRPSIRFDGIRNEDLSTNDDQFFHDYDNPERSWLCTSPQLALQWSLSSQFSFKASVGKYSRYPALEELYGDRGSTAGNPGLEAETGINRDIGFFWTDHLQDQCRFFLEYAYFDKESQDLLTHVQNSQYTFRVENIGAARIRGHEFHVRSLWASILSLGLNYTYQDARDVSQVPYYRDRYLPNRPLQELTTNLTLSIEPVSLHYDTTYQSHTYLDRANLKEVPDRLVHNLSVEWSEFFDGLSCLLEMRNITDNQIEDMAGYPLPGRSFSFSVHYQLTH